MFNSFKKKKLRCGVPFQQELENAEIIPMPDNSETSTQDQLPSFSESTTSPYEELKELKAAAAAVSTKTGLSVKQPAVV